MEAESVPGPVTDNLCGDLVLPPGTTPQAVGGVSLPVHTPGPWAISDYGSSIITNAADLPPGRTFGYGCGSDHIASLNDGEYHEYADALEQAANARLIAAAPDLLEAARDLILGMTSTFRARNGRDVGVQGDDGEKVWLVHSDLITSLETAIAKALGQDGTARSSQPIREDQP